jgi:hypothetical protein
MQEESRKRRKAHKAAHWTGETSSCLAVSAREMPGVGQQHPEGQNTVQPSVETAGLVVLQGLQESRLIVYTFFPVDLMLLLVKKNDQFFHSLCLFPTDPSGFNITTTESNAFFQQRKLVKLSLNMTARGNIFIYFKAIGNILMLRPEIRHTTVYRIAYLWFSKKKV